MIANPYEGEYEVTPSGETQTLQTRNKTLQSNITVNPVGLPFADVSGTTATASRVRSGYKFVDANGVLTNGTYSSTSDWRSVAIVDENNRSVSSISVANESGATFTYKLAQQPTPNAAFWVRIQRSMTAQNENQFTASDSIFIVPLTAYTYFTPNVVMWCKRISSGGSVITTSSRSTAQGMMASAISKNGSYYEIVISARSTSTTLCSGVYSVFAYILTYPQSFGGSILDK